MSQSRDSRRTDHAYDQKAGFDGLASVPPRPYMSEDVTRAPGTDEDASTGLIEQPPILHGCAQMYVYMHEGAGFELPNVQVGNLRAYIMSRPYVIERSAISADLDDWVVISGLNPAFHLDDFPDAVPRDWDGPVDICTIIRDLLPARTGNHISNPTTAATLQHSYRYLDGRLLDQPEAIPVNLGNLRVLESVPQDEWQKDYKDVIEDMMTSVRLGYVVLQPHQLFRGVKTLDLVEALHERAVIANSCQPWPKTAASEFFSYHERLQAAIRALASLTVDTYISYALFRGLRILSESLTDEARSFFADRGWDDLSWQWPGFVEPLRDNYEFRAALAAHRLYEDRCQLSWIQSAEPPKPSVGQDGDTASNAFLAFDPESVLDDDPFAPEGYKPVFAQELRGRGGLDPEIVMRERTALYERFSSFPPPAQDWVGFLRCAEEAPLTEQQRRSVGELSWNEAYPDRYQKEGFCLIPFRRVYDYTWRKDTQDFFSGNIKEGVAKVIERQLLALLSSDRSTEKLQEITHSEEVAQKLLRGSEGAVVSSEATVLYDSLADDICRVALQRVSSKAPVVNGEKVDCVGEVKEILKGRVKQMISDEACDLLEWLRRFHNLHTSRSLSGDCSEVKQ